MLDIRSEYEKKLVTADEAAAVVKSGDWVDFAWGCSTPDTLDRALAKRLPELHDVKFRGGMLMRRPAIADIENPAEHFCWNSWHMTGVERKMIDEGFAFYSPMRYSEMPSYYRDILPGMDVAMLMVPPMDKHGWFNFGPNCTHIREVLNKAKKIILEVNTNLPQCYGLFDHTVHISEVDMVVEGDNNPIGELPGATNLTDVDRAVASYVVQEIPQGACLQLGIGAMPSAIGQEIMKSDLQHLAVHTELYTDEFMNLTLAGKIDGSKKPLDHGKQVYAFAGGSRALYDFLDGNPECQGAPVSYVNAIRTLARIPNFISINGAVDIDLYGQISAESAGTRHISGVGGQQDFVMGAYLSEGGKSFITVSSTVTNKKTGEKKSRIRPTMMEGTITSCTRTNADYIVTEYGIAHLKGLTTWQRAEALIGIAHPDFRDELIAAAEKQKIWRNSNKR